MLYGRDVNEQNFFFWEVKCMKYVCQLPAIHSVAFLFEVFHSCLATMRVLSEHIVLFFSRSYWVGDISWTHDSLFLACMLKRGSLVLLTCQGELLTLITFGCSVEFGPAEFIPLHPLITYR